VVERETPIDGSLPARTAMTVVQNLLRNRFAGRTIRIYEAGGGSISYLPPEMLRSADVTVVDLDATQIATNRYARSKICGDIQVQEFPEASFDLIVCYNVIEHIERPDRAIQRFLDALAPGGWAFIAAPNPRSFSGLATRYTPHWFHVWFYRNVLGHKNAGLPGNAPFPIVYHPLVSPQALIRFCKASGYTVAYFQEFESSHLGALRQRRPVVAKILNAFIRALEIVSRQNLRRGDFHIVLEKPAQ
jgi:2-polyprenyl-3-methyl-5-hydroxy-6-metoxy-1,4-benzoquinol methylase